MRNWFGQALKYNYCFSPKEKGGGANFCIEKTENTLMKFSGIYKDTTVSLKFRNHRDTYY